MKILLVTGQPKEDNSSTNIFVKMIIDELSKRHELTVIRPNRNIETNKANYYYENNVKFIEVTLLSSFQLIINNILKVIQKNRVHSDSDLNKYIKGKRKEKAYKIFYSNIYRAIHKIYGDYYAWLKRSHKISCSENYDLLISISHPTASHSIARKIWGEISSCDNEWVQIWFEPWDYDEKKRNKSYILKEEEKLITRATRIYYVNPIFLNKQRNLFPHFNYKMFNIDLPTQFPKMDYDLIKPANTFISVGYFGNYNSNVRNILPFYNVISNMKSINGYIIGDSNIELDTRENIVIKSKVPYDEITNYEKKCDVIVVIFNYEDLIPGKVYHLSSSNKYILCILDGSKRTKNIIKEYFSKFNRFIFCENDERDIQNKLESILKGEYEYIVNEPINEFHVSCFVNKILNEGTDN